MSQIHNTLIKINRLELESLARNYLADSENYYPTEGELKEVREDIANDLNNMQFVNNEFVYELIVLDDMYDILSDMLDYVSLSDEYYSEFQNAILNAYHENNGTMFVLQIMVDVETDYFGDTSVDYYFHAILPVTCDIIAENLKG